MVPTETTCRASNVIWRGRPLPEYRLVGEDGFEFGRVRLDREPESFEEVLRDERSREEFRESGCQCHAFPRGHRVYRLYAH